MWGMVRLRRKQVSRGKAGPAFWGEIRLVSGRFACGRGESGFGSV